MPVLRLDTYIYGVGKAADGAGMSISAAAKSAPAGGFGGMMETLAIMLEVPLGAAGMGCTVRVEESSWRV